MRHRDGQHVRSPALLNDLELAGFHRDVVNEYGGNHDPGDAEPSERDAIGNGARDHVDGHAKEPPGRRPGSSLTAL